SLGGSDDVADVDSALRGAGPESRAVLIGFRPGGFANRSEVASAGAAVHTEWADLEAVAAHMPGNAIDGLAHNPNVEFIEEDRPVYATGGPGSITGGSAGITLDPNPPAYKTAGSAGEETWGVKDVQATAVWDANGDGALDTGAPVGR